MDQEVKYYNSIGVIGHKGMVGGAVYRYFKDKGYEVHGYDIREPEDEEKTFQSELIFVCVPTPYNWEDKKFDLTLVRNVMQTINARRNVQKGTRPVVVLKSTVKIGSTDYLQRDFPYLKILFNPEFLSEKTCDEDFRNPDRQFVGYTGESYDESTKVANTLPLSPYSVTMPARQAEFLKYINNVHGAFEIMESNMWYEVAQAEGLDYDNVLKGALASKWVGAPMGRHYRVIHHKGKRGFAGKCFPKDINAFIEYLQEKKIDATLPVAARDMNKRILAEQGFTEKDSEKL